MLRWLATWKRRLFWPAKNTGATGAFACVMRRAVNVFHSVSMARLCQTVGVVDTPPAGKITRHPPFRRCAFASARDFRLVLSASSVSAKSIGRRIFADLFGPVENGIRQHAEIVAHLRDEVGDHDAVEHAVRMVRDDDQRTCLRPCRELGLVEDDLELELADRRIPEAFARDGIVAVVLVEPFQIGLAGDAFDQADEEALEARVFRRCVGKGIDRIRPFGA